MQICVTFKKRFTFIGVLTSQGKSIKVEFYAIQAMYNVKHRLFMSEFERFLMRSKDFTPVPSGLGRENCK